MSKILLPLDDPDRGVQVPGKPFEDTVLTPPGADDGWYAAYDAWLSDDTGGVAPPAGYEGWSTTRALRDYDAEYERLVTALKELWGDRWGTWEKA